MRGNDMKKYIPYLFVIFLLGLGVYVIYRFLIPYAVATWDEAVYLLWVYNISQAIKAFDPITFIKISREQYIYPPLQSWIIGFIMSPFRFSIAAVRYVGIIWFIASGLLLYAHAHNLGENITSRYRMGVVTLLIYISSPLILFLSSLAMREMIGLAFTLAVSLMYLKFKKTRASVWAILTGIGCVGLFLIKYYYAVVVITALAVEWILANYYYKDGKKTIKDFNAMFLIILVGCLLVVIGESPRIWNYLYFYRFFSLAQRPAFLNNAPILSHLPTEPGTGTVTDKIFFYPRSIVYVFSLTPLVGLAIITFFIAAFRYMYDFRIRFYVLLASINIITMGLWVPNLVDRLIATTVPFLFLITAYITDKICRYLTVRFRWGKAAFLAIFSVILMYFALQLPSLPHYIYATSAFSFRSPTFNQQDYKDTLFTYDARKWPQKNPGESPESVDDIIRFISSNINLERPYRIIGQSNELSPQYLKLMLSLAKERKEYPSLPYPSYICTIEVLPTSQYYDRDYKLYNRSSLEHVDKTARDATLRKLTSKTFSELGIRVTVYIPK